MPDVIPASRPAHGSLPEQDLGSVQVFITQGLERLPCCRSCSSRTATPGWLVGKEVTSYTVAETVARVFAATHVFTLAQGRGGFRQPRPLLCARSVRAFSRRRPGHRTLRPLPSLERIGLGCAGHVVGPAFSPIGNARDTLDKFVQFAIEQRNGRVP